MEPSTTMVSAPSGRRPSHRPEMCCRAARSSLLSAEALLAVGHGRHLSAGRSGLGKGWGSEPPNWPSPEHDTVQEFLLILHQPSVSARERKRRLAPHQGSHESGEASGA